MHIGNHSKICIEVPQSINTYSELITNMHQFLRTLSQIWIILQQNSFKIINNTSLFFFFKKKYTMALFTQILWFLWKAQMWCCIIIRYNVIIFFMIFLNLKNKRIFLYESLVDCFNQIILKHISAYPDETILVTASHCNNICVVKQTS